MLTTAKQLLFSGQPSVREIKAGILRGIRMHVALSREMQIWLGLRERELHPWFRRLSRGIEAAVDIGASKGEYTLYFLARTEAKRILAFEPDEACRLNLYANLDVNGLTDDPRLLIVPQQLGSPDFDETPLDSFLPVLPDPCLIKIDAEGWEERILMGAPRLLNRLGVRFIIETHHKGLEERCEAVLKKKNFRTEIVHAAWWRRILPERRTEPHNRWLIAWRD